MEMAHFVQGGVANPRDTLPVPLRFAPRLDRKRIDFISCHHFRDGARAGRTTTHDP